jgi:hypothetical protein
MKLVVDTQPYTNFKYSAYLEGYDTVKTPDNPTYVVGQVVVIEREQKKGYFEIAVILGCIDESSHETVRLDLCGMTPIEKIRPANIDDFGKSNIAYRDALHKDCRGFKVSRDWDTYEYTIEEPKF